MADPSLFDILRLPSGVLIALDNRAYHFAMQPWHHVLRATHVVSTAAFFGGIILLDLRLTGVRTAAALRPLSLDILPSLYAVFAIALTTGAGLFLYDPVHVGSHAYFVPKMLLIFLGLTNAGVYNRFAYETALASQGGLPRSARIAGSLSLVLWAGVMIFASLNAEGPPRVLLQ